MEKDRIALASDDEDEGDGRGGEEEETLGRHDDLQSPENAYREYHNHNHDHDEDEDDHDHEDPSSPAMFHESGGSSSSPQAPSSSSPKEKDEKPLLKSDGDDDLENGHEHGDDFYQTKEKPKPKSSSSRFSAPPPVKVKKPWYKRLLKHKKTVLLTLFLFIVGVVFLALGVIYLGHSEKSSTAFFVIAALTVIPGGYQVYYIARILKGDDGYRFSQIPNGGVNA